MRRHSIGLILLALVYVFAGRASADTLYISEYPELPPVTFQAAPAPIRSTTVAIAASSAQSLPFLTNTRLVRLHCDVACLVEVGGTNPTATPTSARMLAGQTEYFYVKAGARVAVIVAPAVVAFAIVTQGDDPIITQDFQAIVTQEAP